MHDPRYRHVQSPGAAASVLTVVLTGIAFWLSYEHLAEVASGHGLPGVRGWAWPAVVDLFIVIGELLFLQASLQQKVDPFAIFMTAVGSLGSVGLNVAGVGGDASTMEYVVAGAPPVAALIAFGALMRQVHKALKDRQPLQPPAPPLQEALVDHQPQVSGLVERPAVEPLQSPPDALPAWVEEALETPTIDQETLVEKLVAGGEPLPGRPALIKEYGVTDWVARRALEIAKERLQEEAQHHQLAKEN